MGVPQNHPKLDHFSLETYGFGDPPLSRSPIILHHIASFPGRHPVRHEDLGFFGVMSLPGY